MKNTDGTTFWLFYANLKRRNLHGKLLNSAALSKLKLLQFSFVLGNLPSPLFTLPPKWPESDFFCSKITWIRLVSDSVNSTSQIQFRLLPTVVLNRRLTGFFFLMQHGLNSQHLMQVWRLSGATYVTVLWKRTSSLWWYKKKTGNNGVSQWRDSKDLEQN